MPQCSLPSGTIVPLATVRHCLTGHSKMLRPKLSRTASKPTDSTVLAIGKILITRNRNTAPLKALTSKNRLPNLKAPVLFVARKATELPIVGSDLSCRCYLRACLQPIISNPQLPSRETEGTKGDGLSWAVVTALLCGENPPQHC